MAVNLDLDLAVLEFAAVAVAPVDWLERAILLPILLHHRREAL